MLGELMMFWPPPLLLQGRQSLKAMWSGETLPSGSGESSCAGDRHYLLWSRWCCCRLRVEAASKNLQWQNALREIEPHYFKLVHETQQNVSAGKTSFCFHADIPGRESSETGPVNLPLAFWQTTNQTARAPTTNHGKFCVVLKSHKTPGSKREPQRQGPRLLQKRWEC